MFFKDEDNEKYENQANETPAEEKRDTKIEYGEQDLAHAQVLKDLAVMCRSEKRGFTDTTRLEVVREKLADSPYSEISYEGAPFSMWSKKPLEELPEDVILISTHADIVDSITECSSELKDTGFYSGTYDNIGTNAAAVILMQEHDLPDNVVFAFTADEETGRCIGAKLAANYLTETERNLTCIALDVTYEGFWDNRLWSLENLSAPKEGREDFLSTVADAAMATDLESSQSFCFVKAGKKFVPENLAEKYIEDSSGMYDEAFAYKDNGYPAMSICLPCNGSMHSNSGVVVKQPVFEGYVLSLASFVYSLTHTHEQLIEAYKIAKENLIAQASNIAYARPVYRPSFTSGYFHNNSFYDYDDEDDTKNSWDYMEEDDSVDDLFCETDELCELSAMLYSEAVTYFPDEEEDFVKDHEIPYEYLGYFCSDPDGAILPEEEKWMENYLRSLFRTVHGIDLEEEKVGAGLYSDLASEYADDDDGDYVIEYSSL